MRKFVAVVVLALVALFAVPMVSAGAQTAPPAPGCVILSTAPNPVTAFPSVVTVTGTVESGVDITLYGQSPPLTGPTVALASQHATGGTFALQADLPAETDLSVNFTYGDGNAYAASCATPGGEVVVRVKTATATDPGAGTAARSLAFTGSSDTPSFLLIGIAAVLVGAVLVIAARRRSHLS